MLQVSQLTIAYQTEKGAVNAVNEVDFTVKPGSIVGLVGESGCGKSTFLYSLMGLSSGKIVSGDIQFKRKNLAALSAREWRKIRGNDISMVFQDPMTTLNPAFKVGDQIRESLAIHQKGPAEEQDGFFSRMLGRKDREREEKERVLELMKEVGIPAPEMRYKEYPHQFSGGMQQRALIAIALCCEPDLLLADEPTTALDVTIQAQILQLLKKINETRGTSIILVTHDLAVAAEFCDEIAVMYAGRIVERGKVDDVIENPKHPYTQGLLRSIPKIGSKEKLRPISGTVIDLVDLAEGCEFAPRCEFRKEACNRPVPMVNIEKNHTARCVLYRKEGERDELASGSR